MVHVCLIHTHHTHTWTHTHIQHTPIQKRQKVIEKDTSIYVYGCLQVYMHSPVYAAAHICVHTGMCIYHTKKKFKRSLERNQAVVLMNFKAQWLEESWPLLFFHRQGHQGSRMAGDLELSAVAGLPDQRSYPFVPYMRWQGLKLQILLNILVSLWSRKKRLETKSGGHQIVFTLKAGSQCTRARLFLKTNWQQFSAHW